MSWREGSSPQGIAPDRTRPARPYAQSRTGHRRRMWLRVFLVGLALWIACLLVILLTANANLVPSLILLGSFLAPVTFVVWAFERWRDEHVTAELVVTCFVTGGLLGVLGAALLETYLLHPSPYLFLGVGLIEEAVKFATLAYLTRHLPRRHARDGIVLGAAVGFGFAAFESAGYAFNALLTVRGLSLADLVQTELIRGLLSPVGHGLWTAILGGILFSRDRRANGAPLRFSRTLLLAYLWVSLLHALWDSANEIAVLVTFLLTGSPWQIQLLRYGYIPAPTPEQVHLFTVFSNTDLVVVGLLGIGTLATVWRRYRDPAPQLQ